MRAGRVVHTEVCCIHFFIMNKIATFRYPYIFPGSEVKEAVFTIPEFNRESRRIQMKDPFAKGAKPNRGKISIYLNDGTNKHPRSTYVEMDLFSEYGLSKYEGESSDAVEVVETKEPAKGKKFNKPLTIAFSLESNPGLDKYAAGVDEIVTRIMTKELPKVTQQLCPGDAEVTIKHRKCAKISAGSTVRNVRLTAWPGSTQLLVGPTERPNSMNSFPQGETGRYKVIACPHHIDVVYKEGVLSYGCINQVKLVWLRDEPTAVLKWRNDSSVDEEEKEPKKRKRVETDDE